MALGDMRVEVLVAVAAAAGLAFAVQAGAPTVHADHISGLDFVHAPLQYAAEFPVPLYNGHFDGWVAVGTDRIIVSGSFTPFVRTFDLSGNHLDSFGHVAFAPGAIAIDKFNLFVADYYYRIRVFDLSGSHLGSLGSNGTAPGQLNLHHSSGLALNSTHLFVADTGNNRVQVFSLSGGASAFGGSVLIPNGTGLGHVYYPQSIALNSTHLFVVDGYFRIQIFDIAGNYVGKLGTRGDGPGEFAYSSGIAASPTHIFVVDGYHGHDRIQIFDMAGNYAGTFGRPGDGPGKFDAPYGIALNSTHLFVTDLGHDRIQIFTLPGNWTAP